MKAQEVFIVVLRRPKLSNPHEKREDPFWEFGSFGSTGCHRRNLLNPNEAKDRLEGARLAFAQGGREGFKLVMLTPPVRIDDSKCPCESKWKRDQMPFRYEDAPLLVDYDGRSDFPFLQRRFRKQTWGSPVQQFSSSFRSRAKSLTTKESNALVRIYEVKVRKARAQMFAGTYLEALPYPPPVCESLKERRQSYRAELEVAEKCESGEKAGSSRSRKNAGCRGKN